MTLEQGIVLGVIVGIFGLFAWGKWRYDIVAVIGLFSLVVADVIVVKVLRRGGSDHASAGALCQKPNVAYCQPLRGSRRAVGFHEQRRGIGLVAAGGAEDC